MTQIIRSNGTTEEVKNKLTLKFMQGVVGGDIEIIPFGNDKELICNEEGKLQGLPLNVIATKLWIDYYGGADLIVGDVIITDSKELD